MCCTIVYWACWFLPLQGIIEVAMRITDYFYTPKDIWNGLRIRHAVGFVAALFIVTGLHILGVGTDVTLFAASIVATQIWKMDPRVPFVGAIGCFIAIMVASVVSSEASSSAGALKERLAVIAFYFLVLGVLLLLREHIKPPKQKPYIRDIPRQEYELDELAESLPGSVATTPIKTQTPSTTSPAKPVYPLQARQHHAPTVHTQSHQSQASTAHTPPVPTQQPARLHVQPQQVASMLKHVVRKEEVHAPTQHQQETPASKPVALPHMQRSPYLLDLRVPQKPKQPLHQQHKRSISDVAPPKGFTAKRPAPRGPIQL